MKKFKSTASYNRKHPTTGAVEQTSRWLEGFYTNKGAIEADLMKQVKLDDVLGKVVFDTRRVK